MRGTKAASGPTVLQARLFSPAEAQLPKPLPAPPAPPPPSPKAVSAQPDVVQASSSRNLQATSPAPAAPERSDEQSVEARAARDSVPIPAGELDGYVPRSMLTEPPVVQTPVVIAEPSLLAPSIGVRTGILALYIDEEGRVQEVVGQAPSLPAEYEQAAREAFLAARYSPGRIDGRAVKSRVRVEVKFNGAASPP
ncbi:hypothetical protein AB4Z46_14880 [Variovorax sp. M-6]